MAGFTKLFSDIVDSSIWNENHATCRVWITLLALSNADGFVRGSDNWLRGKSKTTPEECAEALKILSAPDNESRSKDFEGRRIEILDDGFLILNYLKFRDMLSPSEKASASRERVRKHRERYKALRNASSVTNVTKGVPASAPSSSASVPKALGEESVREGGLSDTERISLERSLERVNARLEELKGPDLLCEFKLERQSLKSSRKDLLSKLGLPA